MVVLQPSVVVTVAGGFVATIDDHGDTREITIRRETKTFWVHHEITQASLDTCVRRFSTETASRGAGLE